MSNLLDSVRFAIETGKECVAVEGAKQPHLLYLCVHEGEDDSGIDAMALLNRGEVQALRDILDAFLATERAAHFEDA